MKNRKIIGMSSAGMVALFQGLEGVIFTFFGLVLSVAAVFTTTSFAVATVFLRESIIFVALSLMFWPHIKSSFRRMKRKDGRILFLSGFFTATGNFFYILSISLAGSSYGPVLTTLYPIFSLILLRILFKERQNWIVRGGVVLSIFSGLLFMLLPSLLSKEGFNLMKLLGMFFGMLGALLWAAEGMLIKKSIDVSKTHPANHQELLLIRTFSAWVVTLIFVVPMGFIPAEGTSLNPFTMMGKIIADYKAFLIVFAIALGVLLLRFFHANAIKKIGPKLTAIIDTNNFIIPAFLAIFLSFGNFENVATHQLLFETFEWWVWLLTIPLMIGVLITIIFEKTERRVEEIIFDRYIE